MNEDELKELIQPAEQRNVTIQYNLGNAHWVGDSVKGNLEKAKYWYRKAAANGHSEAQHRLNELKKETSNA